MVQIIGFCRFSYIGHGDWRVSKTLRETTGSEQEWRDGIASFLFEEKRMEHRFKTVADLCIRSLAAQTDQNFTFVFIVSDTMPDHYLERLMILCEPHENLFIQVSHPRKTSDVVRSFLNDFIDHPEDGKLVQFRLDDDGLPIDYIERLRHVAFVHGDPNGMAFSMGHSLTVCLYGNETKRTFLHTKPFQGAGFAILTPPKKRTVFSGGHFAVGKHLKTYVITDQIASIVLKHDNNDSRYIMHNQAENERLKFFSIDENEFEKLISEKFPYLSDVDWGKYICEEILVDNAMC